MSSELLDIDDPLLPRLREAAIRDDEAHRWLLESARRWARGEFFRREQAREAALMGDYQERLRHGVANGELRLDMTYLEERVRRFTHKQVAVLADYQEHVRAPSAERIKVGLLLPESNEEYLKMMVGRTETFAALLGIYDIIELAPQFRTRKWPTDDDLPRTARLEAERKQRRDEAWQRMNPVLSAPGDTITYTETITSWLVPACDTRCDLKTGGSLSWCWENGVD